MDAKERRLEDLTELQNAHAELHSNPHFNAVRKTYQQILAELREELEELSVTLDSDAFASEARVLLSQIQLMKRIIGQPAKIRTQIDGMLNPPGPIIHKGER